MTFTVICTECGHKETFYTQGKPPLDCYCANCGAIVQVKP